MVVTSATHDYLPGVIALRNSLERNSPGHDLVVLAYGDEAFAERLDALGFNYLLNQKVPGRLPCSYKCETPNPAMYSRLLIPQLFEDSRSLYIDADSIVLKPVDCWLDADMQGYAVGGTPSWAPVETEVIGIKRPHEFGVMSAVLVFDRNEWIKQDIFQRCIKAFSLEGQLHFKTVVQAVLQYVLDKDWHKFPAHWQVQGGHQTTPDRIGNAKILHFAGTNPWDEMPSNLLPMPEHKKFTRGLWRQYA